MLRKTLLAASLATVMFASPVMAQDAAPAEDQVLATVNGEEILESEVRATQQGLPQQYRQLPFEMLKPMLVDREINLERAIAEKVTDDAIKAHYDEFIKTNEPEPQVHARHILLENEDDAKAVIAELDDGADFVELAKEKSTGPSGPNGGDLGFFNKGDMVAPFAEAAFAMEPGTYSKEPVQTQFGWHVILVEEKKDGVQPTLEEIRQQMEAEVTQQAVQDLIEELRSDAEVVNNTETPATDDSAETPKN